MKGTEDAPPEQDQGEEAAEEKPYIPKQPTPYKKPGFKFRPPSISVPQQNANFLTRQSNEWGKRRL